MTPNVMGRYTYRGFKYESWFKKTRHGYPRLSRRGSKNRRFESLNTESLAGTFGIFCGISPTMTRLNNSIRTAIRKIGRRYGNTRLSATNSLVGIAASKEISMGQRNFASIISSLSSRVGRIGCPTSPHYVKIATIGHNPHPISENRLLEGRITKFNLIVNVHSLSLLSLFLTLPQPTNGCNEGWHRGKVGRLLGRVGS